MEFTVPMALVDYIPVVAFLITSIVLLDSLYGKMSKLAYSLFSAGMISVTFAGFMKATYKLLYALGACDFSSLNAMFMPVQSIGFLLAGVGMILTVTKLNKNAALMAAVPPVFKGTFVFVGAMVAGLALVVASLCVLSVKLKKGWITVLFICSFICLLGMGYLSSQDFTQAAMNWVAQSVNIVGQAFLLGGTLLLKKAGLKE